MVNSTISLIKVKDVKDDVIILEDGSLRAILAVPGINFSLLSERERGGVIGLFKELLDGIDFNLQILVVSRLASIENYIKNLEDRLEEEEEELIKVQLEEYIKFLKEYIEMHKIMKKLFYIVVPYETPVVKLGGILKKEIKKEEDYRKMLEQLETRIIYITEKLSVIGLQPIRLNNAELIHLLFEMYNPNLRWGTAPIKLFQELIEVSEK
ncbi:MAG: TraC family protein [Minisyncoccia bacterium]